MIAAFSIALRFNGTRAGSGGDAGGSGGSDTAESKPEAGVSAEDASEDSGRDGGGPWVGLAGTLTGRLQWGHSILARALLSSIEMFWMQ